MRKLGIAVCAIILSVLLVGGCASRENAPSALKEQPIPAGSYNMSVVKTVGNYSYIPLNISGRASNNAGEILGALNAFEEAHPELEVISWEIEKYITSAYTYGIWVFHRPKK